MLAMHYEPQPWYRDALCTTEGREFYDFPENKREIKISKGVCKVCPVRLECLAYAFTYRIEFGIWGGLTDKERSMMKPFLNLPTTMSEDVVLSILSQRIRG